jgi:hypothetical protein
MKALQSFETLENTRPKTERQIPKTCIFGNIIVRNSRFASVILADYVPTSLDYKPQSRGFHSRWGHWDFSLTWSFRPHYGPGFNPGSERNEYQEYLLGNKGGPCVRLIALPPSCADCLQSWKPKLPGALRAIPGIYGDRFTFILSCSYLIWTYFIFLLYYSPTLKLWFHIFPLSCIEIIPYCWWELHYIFPNFRRYFSHDNCGYYKSIENEHTWLRKKHFSGAMTSPICQIPHNSARKSNSSIAELRFQRGRRTLRYEGRMSMRVKTNIRSVYSNVHSFKLYE